MHLHPDLHHRLVLDRQHELRADAAALRLAGERPLRARLARSLRRVARRAEPAVAPPRPRRPLPECG